MAECQYGEITQTRADAAFIAAANPTAVLALLDERDALRAQVERVRALHHAGPHSPAVTELPWCVGCYEASRVDQHPCATIAALDGPQ